jgi:hypothetical protein
MTPYFHLVIHAIDPIARFGPVYGCMYIHMNVTMEDLAASITMDMQAANWKQC